MSTLVLIDGHSQMYRALFTRGPILTGPSGEVTTGTYVFTRMLFQIVRHLKPDYLLMAMDGPKEHLERRRWFPEYKANRTGRSGGEPIDFSQLDRMVDIVEALGVQIATHSRWEADDIIASAVGEYGPGLDTVIVTRDKDFHQLVSPKVILYDPQSGDTVRVENVRNRWGVEPEQVADVLALAGDSSDNLPGVRGIGLKGAIQLIQAYGSIHGLIEGRDSWYKLGAALQKKLEGADLNLCYLLVKLNKNLPFNHNIEEFRFTGLRVEAAAGIFRQLGFKRLAEAGGR